MTSQVEASKPARVAQVMPRRGSSTTRAPNSAATAAESSVDPLSTTMISSAGTVWSAKAARQRRRSAASFKQGITTPSVRGRLKGVLSWFFPPRQ